MTRQCVKVFEDSRGPGTCRGCAAALDWYDTVAGKHMPVNSGAVPVRSEQDEATWRVVAVFDAADTHWATCPDRQRFKKTP